MPDIVHADEDAQHSRLQIKRVLLPASLQIGDFVAADSSVVDFQTELRMILQQPARNQKWVAIPKRARMISLPFGPAISASIRDRITLKQNDVVFLQCDFRVSSSGTV